MNESFTHHEVELIAEQAAARAIDKVVSRILIRYGIDPEEPLEVQKDMAFVRNMRATHERIKGKSWIVITGLIITGALVMFWKGLAAGLKETLGG